MDIAFLKPAQAAIAVEHRRSALAVEAPYVEQIQATDEWIRNPLFMWPEIS